MNPQDANTSEGTMPVTPAPGTMPAAPTAPAAPAEGAAPSEAPQA